MKENNKLTKVNKDKEYLNVLTEIKSILEKGQFKAYKAVDNIKVQTYWQIGERIVREELRHGERANYGEYLISNLSLDLEVNKRDLYRITKFYRCYQIVGSVIPQLSWTHYYHLVDIENDKKRLFYQHKAVLESWSVRELKKQLKANLFDNTPAQEIEDLFKAKLTPIKPSKIFKETYNFDFIKLGNMDSEKYLENKIVSNFEHFLKEMGGDFSILSRQMPLKIDSETHFVDLVLYHRGIPCVVLVDLKVGKLDSRDVGQMNKYISFYRRNRQYEHEKDAIGLIICKEAGKEEVVYALDGLEEKIFVAKYKVKLPSEAKIKKIINKI